MPGESQEVPVSGVPDPSVLTTDALALAIRNLKELAESEQSGAVAVLDEKIKSIHRESAIREAHRLELKADSEKALSTAREADQKAVAAALAAAEKAREQQTIASQLATNKAETAFVESLAQQQQTFSVAINNVVQGLNEVKGVQREDRAARRGGKELVNAIYAFAAFLVALVVIGGFVVAFK